MLNTYVALGFASCCLFLMGWVTYRYAPMVGRNPWFGFITDWAMQTHDNWERANRLAGQAFMMTAVALVPTSLLFMQAIPQGAAPAAVIIGMLVNGAVGLRWVVKNCR
ncbi:MAG TPA: SdpI family protein [Gammaproteobacteria bacterium]|nr:SdpI family protein [Gammaproteobacteria bacterium]